MNRTTQSPGSIKTVRKLVAGFVLAGVAAGLSAAPAYAYDNHHRDVHRRVIHRDYRRGPPVVVAPSYEPPPVIYSPPEEYNSPGINLMLNFR